LTSGAYREDVGTDAAGRLLRETGRAARATGGPRRIRKLESEETRVAIREIWSQIEHEAWDAQALRDPQIRVGPPPGSGPDPPPVRLPMPPMAGGSEEGHKHDNEDEAGRGADRRPRRPGS
jgi:hypothetical protein